MNLINKKVTHKSFGIGSIVQQNESSIEINFETENKKFVFPDVFGSYLTLHDKEDAKSLEVIIQNQELERKEEEMKKEEEKLRLQKKHELRLEYEKLMKNHKLHPESQMVFWCEPEEQDHLFSEWKAFSGLIKSGNNKGKPNKPIRLHQNSAVLVTEVDPGASEKERRILGVYMVNEGFVGKLCVDGYIPAHTKYKIKLTEEESNQLHFWTYYIDVKSPEKVTWSSGKYRYFNNLWMAQILHDIVSLKTNPKEQELARQFLKHFCKINQITDQELPKPSGVLTRA